MNQLIENPILYIDYIIIFLTPKKEKKKKKKETKRTNYDERKKMKQLITISFIMKMKNKK